MKCLLGLILGGYIYPIYPRRYAPGRYAVIGCKLKQNADEGCNSCASLAGLVLCFISCFILLVIAPLRRTRFGDSHNPAGMLTEAAHSSLFERGQRRQIISAFIIYRRRRRRNVSCRIKKPGSNRSDLHAMAGRDS